MKSFLFLFCMQIICSLACHGPVQQLPPAAKTQVGLQPANKPGSSFSDTATINYSAAVLYHADSLQLEKINKITDSGVFKSTMHQLFYQQRNSRIVLRKYYPAIKIVEVTNARWLLFVLKDGTKKLIDLDKNNDPEGLYIFNTKKDPLVVDMMNVETDLGFYLSPPKQQ